MSEELTRFSSDQILRKEAARLALGGRSFDDFGSRDMNMIYQMEVYLRDGVDFREIVSKAETRAYKDSARGLALALGVQAEDLEGPDGEGPIWHVLLEEVKELKLFFNTIKKTS